MSDRSTAKLSAREWKGYMPEDAVKELQRQLRGRKWNKLYGCVTADIDQLTGVLMQREARCLYECREGESPRRVTLTIKLEVHDE